MKTQQEIIEDRLADALAEFLIFYLHPIDGPERCRQLRHEQETETDRNENHRPDRRQLPSEGKRGSGQSSRVRK